MLVIMNINKEFWNRHYADLHDFVNNGRIYDSQYVWVYAFKRHTPPASKAYTWYPKEKVSYAELYSAYDEFLSLKSNDNFKGMGKYISALMEEIVLHTETENTIEGLLYDSEMIIGNIIMHYFELPVEQEGGAFAQYEQAFQKFTGIPYSPIKLLRFIRNNVHPEQTAVALKPIRLSKAKADLQSLSRFIINTFVFTVAVCRKYILMYQDMLQKNQTVPKDWIKTYIEEKAERVLGKYKGAGIDVNVILQRQKYNILSVKWNVGNRSEEVTGNRFVINDVNNYDDVDLVVELDNENKTERHIKISIAGQEKTANYLVQYEDGEYKEIDDSQLASILSEAANSTNIQSNASLPMDNDKLQDVESEADDEENTILLVAQDIIKVRLEGCNHRDEDDGVYEVYYKLHRIEVVQQQATLNLYWRLRISRPEPHANYDIANIGQYDFNSAHKGVDKWICANYGIILKRDYGFEYNDIIEEVSVLSGEGGSETETLRVVDNKGIELTVGYREFKNNKKLERVYLGNKIVISSEAFQNCSNLMAVYVGEGTEQRFSHRAFKGCSMLNSIVITENMGEEAFADCEKLESVVFREISEQITKISKGAFKNCKSLEHISLPTDVEEIEDEAFYGSGLKDVIFSSSVKRIGKSAFANCYSLQSLHFPKGFNLKEINAQAFEDCPALKYVTIDAEVLSLEEFKIRYKDLLVEAKIFDLTPRNVRFMSNFKKIFENVLLPSEE